MGSVLTLAKTVAHPDRILKFTQLRITQWKEQRQNAEHDVIDGAGWNLRRTFATIHLLILKVILLIEVYPSTQPFSFVSINADTGTTVNFILLPDAAVLLDIKPVVNDISVALPNGQVIKSTHEFIYITVNSSSGPHFPNTSGFSTIYWYAH
jgi:hypothetical protein